jgi:GT2 family glycosyltransferase
VIRARGTPGQAPAPWVAITACEAPDTLDACLAALDRTLPAGHPVWVTDDASHDPRVRPLLEHWRQRTRLGARVECLPYRLGPAAQANAAFAAAGEADVVLLGADAVVTTGWLDALQRAARARPRVATVSPWGNGGGLAAYPRPGEPNPPPGDAELLASAAAGQAVPDYPELPVASSACVLVTRTALDALGGFDAATLGAAAADDFCRRAAAMGWRHLLCDTAFVARLRADPAPGLDEVPRLLARWPDYHEQVARFLLEDPLRPLRLRLTARVDGLERGGPQRGLFDQAPGAT